jgi:hypothetical protein
MLKSRDAIDRHDRSPKVLVAEASRRRFVLLRHVEVEPHVVGIDAIVLQQEELVARAVFKLLAPIGMRIAKSISEPAVSKTQPFAPGGQSREQRRLGQRLRVDDQIVLSAPQHSCEG